MARTSLLGYGWVVAAAVSLAVLSVGLWVHHMFTTGIPNMALAFFAAASTLVAVPTAVQIFAWIGTLWKGRRQIRLPMLWLLGFFATFVIGGLTGVMIAMVPFNWQAHDTRFIVAHLHYVLVGDYVFPMIAAIYYWLPVFSGRKRYFRLGEVAFWLTVPAFHVTFLALHWAGLLGQRRRIRTYDPGQGWEWINLTASIGGVVLAIGFALVIVDIAINAIIAGRGPRNPWGGHAGMGHPPRAYLEPTLAGPALAGLGAALAVAVAGPRLAERGLRAGGSPWPGLVATGFGLLAWIGASLVVIDGVGAPDSHAYRLQRGLRARGDGLFPPRPRPGPGPGQAAAGDVIALQAGLLWTLWSGPYGSPTRFGRLVSRTLGLSALAATVWTLAPVATLPVCHAGA